MDTLQYNAARLYHCDKTGITVVQHKNVKILGLKARVRYLLFNPQNGDLF
jgi:hypothetical protein